MNKIIYRPTRITPLIFFDPERGLLELRGKSSPENAIEFYGKLLLSLEKFAKQGNKNLVANFKFEYFNTSSSKCIFDILRKINLVKEYGRKLSINWYYEEYDEDMQEAGEDYADLLGTEFNFIETVY
ncbi:DUF1987 domain-containing protein [Reichenbachiella ulvae]|uniref:DUF1987 domain-containing protein n=1 Tax=Reichenbachiella ulvae TaxID=2980104 RepID=A0ABT3CNW6_9BACT|nr:DUF1987 domain-containing protein [Reichenbachiella ulvae]MCV9385164.1 DUF1987 domain-containing protein [Reichenbachiella ulvae]